MSNKRKEIGSEFWFEEELPQAVSDRDGIYVLSGRTAIDLIIQDILETRKIRNVYMPAWCCDSMLAPFVAHGIHVDFYDVRLKCHIESTEKESNTDLTDEADNPFNLSYPCSKHFSDFCENIFYVTNYFGYENTLSVETTKKFKEQGAIILYDRTHSFLMDNDPFIALADYSFASIRKWMGVIGGAVVEGVKNMSLKPYPYLAPKEKAMRMKQAYMAGDDSVDKQEFLRLYGEFGHHLADDYCDYAMDDFSYAIYKATDIQAVKMKRRENAKYLHEHLNLQFLSPLTDFACLLFVPVFFETKEERDRVRKKLIETEIYCPIHWPKPALIPVDFEVNKIYDTELSLICDQRYSLTDMQRIVDVIVHADKNS